jgi:hypothetical protein
MPTQPPPTEAQIQKMRIAQVINCAKLCTAEHPMIMHVLNCGCGKPECLEKMKNTLNTVLPGFSSSISYKITEENRGTDGFFLFVSMAYKKQ